jgi:hypothetical protein
MKVVAEILSPEFGPLWAPTTRSNSQGIAPEAT